MKVTLILGMHRSGTSCLAGSLQAAGLALGDVNVTSKFNKKGNRENPKIKQLNDSVLLFNSGSWDVPPKTLCWNDGHSLVCKQLLDDTFSSVTSELLGIKDPRICITLPFWLEQIDQYQLLGAFRHPSHVARSLNSRNGLPLELGYNLWYEYNKRLLTYYQEAHFPLVSFDVSREAYFQNLYEVASILGLENPERSRDFYAAELNNSQSVEMSRSLPVHVAELYHQLNILYKNQQLLF